VPKKKDDTPKEPPSISQTMTNSPGGIQAGGNVTVNKEPPPVIHSIIIEAKLTSDIKPDAELPSPEVPWWPIGGGIAYLQSQSSQVPLAFVSPVLFNRQSSGKVVVVNRFALQNSSDLYNHPLESLAAFDILYIPVQLITYAKSLDTLRLFEVSMTVNGKHIWSYSYSLQAHIPEGKSVEFRIPLDGVRAKLKQ
jgi:hypothetical protein